jgi:alcohol dehydrogenase
MLAACYTRTAFQNIKMFTLPTPSLKTDTWVYPPLYMSIPYRLVFNVLIPFLRKFIKCIPEPFGYNSNRSNVLIKVKAASINPVDSKLLYGDKFPYFINLIKKFLESRIAGIDVAGVVVDADENSPFKTGDEVYGTVPPAVGSYANYVVTPSDFIAIKPANVSFVQAAAVPLVGLTVTQIFDDHGLKRGMRLLVLGASGGTGHVAVQIAKAYGVHVTGVCGVKNVAFVESLGADRVISYNDCDVIDSLVGAVREGGKYDLVFDSVSSHDPRDHSHSYEAKIKANGVLKDEGMYVIIGGLRNDWIKVHVLRYLGVNLFKKGRILHWVRFPNATPYLDKLRSVIEKGDMIPEVSEVVRFNDDGIQGGFEKQMTRRMVGKIVVDIDSI